MLVLNKQVRKTRRALAAGWPALAAVLLLAGSVNRPALAEPGLPPSAELAPNTIYLPLAFTDTAAEAVPPPDDGTGGGAGVATTYKLYLPLVFKPFPPPPNTFFGMDGTSIEAIDFDGYYAGNLDGNAVLRDKSMDWQQTLGVNYYRNYGSDSRAYSWRFVNPANDVYSWTRWDLLVLQAQQHDITLLASIGNGVPAWANGQNPGCTTCWREKPLDLWTDPMETTAWYKYVHAFVERYDGDGYQDMPGLQKPLKYYELWNEPDLRQGWTMQPTPAAHQFNGDINDYVRLSRVGYMALKAADPNAVMVGPATAQTAGNPDTVLGGQLWFMWDWPDWLNAGGPDYVDIVSFTRYPDTPNWDSENYVDLFLFFAEHNRAGKPVWLTETGWAGSSTDPAQTKASNFARFTFQAWNRFFVDRFFWYSYHEPSYNPVTSGAAKALITTTTGNHAPGCEPDPYFHPTYRAVEVLVDVFSNYSAADRPAVISPNENVRVYRFDKDGQTTWAAWNKATNGTQNITIDTNGREVRKISLFGDDLGIYQDDAPLQLGPWPIYLTTDLNWNQDIGRITGRVRTNSQTFGNGVAGLTVHAAGPVTRDVVTDADGNYIIAGLPEGSYTVTVTGQSTNPANRVVNVDREAPWGRTSFTINGPGSLVCDF